MEAVPGSLKDINEFNLLLYQLPKMLLMKMGMCPMSLSKISRIFNQGHQGDCKFNNNDQNSTNKSPSIENANEGLTCP